MKWRKANPVEARKEDIKKNKIWQRKYKDILRYQVFSAYGGKCICCDESSHAFLTINHINGGGRADRKVRPNLYRWLVDNDFPKDNYRIMCMNCNWGRRFRSVCPHQDAKDATSSIDVHHTPSTTHRNAPLLRWHYDARGWSRTWVKILSMLCGWEKTILRRGASNVISHSC